MKALRTWNEMSFSPCCSLLTVTSDNLLKSSPLLVSRSCSSDYFDAIVDEMSVRASARIKSCSPEVTCISALPLCRKRIAPQNCHFRPNVRCHESLQGSLDRVQKVGDMPAKIVGCWKQFQEVHPKDPVRIQPQDFMDGVFGAECNQVD
jgi:hypothetical protein